MDERVAGGTCPLSRGHADYMRLCKAVELRFINNWSILPISRPSNMPTWNLTLDPKAVAQVHDILVCLGRFGETVSIEARRNKVCLSRTLRGTKNFLC